MYDLIRIKKDDFLRTNLIQSSHFIYYLSNLFKINPIPKNSIAKPRNPPEVESNVFKTVTHSSNMDTPYSAADSDNPINPSTVRNIVIIKNKTEKT